ncbi:MAG: DUF1489 domain-containing protein [Rhodospirillales bacterium]|jgi:hypothetical protein|nr:DUF1489 domain-containing protein [Rhodospirillales bacterium]
MTLHLMKLAVGIDSVAHLRAVQEGRRGEQATLSHPTRHAPKRAEELLAGGSLYWVIRGVIRVRQRLVAIEPGVAAVAAGAARPCLLVLDPALVETVPRPQRPFQGWRYLKGEDAPADAGAVGAGQPAEELPAELAVELAKLGLL